MTSVCSLTPCLFSTHCGVLGARCSVLGARPRSPPATPIYRSCTVQNLCRDARWGRCQETLGEDVFLTSELAAALVPAFQYGGLDDDKYMQVIATCKHFDVHG